MQPQTDALLSSIRAIPDDDAPPLIYADWLKEFADELENDVFAYSEEDGDVRLADELDLD